MAQSEKTHTDINITCEPPEGVDKPWFELSYFWKDTVQWHNPTDKECTLTFTGGPPFPSSVTIDPSGGKSPKFSAEHAPGPPTGAPPDKPYRVYTYSVDCKGGCRFGSPGGGVKPGP
jgi:hypothetical protein